METEKALLNRVLDDTAREEYRAAEEWLFELAPELTARKPSRSIVQHAFVLITAVELHQHGPILVAGAYEDAPRQALETLNRQCVAIDPSGVDCINMTLEEYLALNPTQTFQLGYANSVLEHIVDDEGFIRTLCRMIEPGGFAFLTFDFNHYWDLTIPQPTTSLRQYSLKDIDRLQAVFISEGFEIYGDIDYTGELDFEWENCKYSFASMVAKKAP